MPFKSNLVSDPNYEFEWPTTEGYPLEDKIKFFLRRLSHEVRKGLDNSLLKVDAGTVGSGKRRNSPAQNTEGMKVSWAIGDIKEAKLKASIQNWDNIVDEKLNKPVPYSFARLQDLLAQNGGLDPNEFGSLEGELLDLIDTRNNLSRKDLEDEEGN